MIKKGYVLPFKDTDCGCEVLAVDDYFGAAFLDIGGAFDVEDLDVLIEFLYELREQLEEGGGGGEPTH